MAQKPGCGMAGLVDKTELEEWVGCCILILSDMGISCFNLVDFDVFFEWEWIEGCLWIFLDLELDDCGETKKKWGVAEWSQAINCFQLFCVFIPESNE